jgi:hypothetical protein
MRRSSQGIEHTVGRNTGPALTSYSEPSWTAHEEPAAEPEVAAFAPAAPLGRCHRTRGRTADGVPAGPRWMRHAGGVLAGWHPGDPPQFSLSSGIPGRPDRGEAELMRYQRAGVLRRRSCPASGGHQRRGLICSKLRYREEIAAKLALAGAQRKVGSRRSRIEVRAYCCHRCRTWREFRDRGHGG